MNKSLFWIFICLGLSLCFQTPTFNLPSGLFPPKSYGYVPILKCSTEFHIHVDFEPNFDNPNNANNVEQNHMMLSLYTSRTLFTGSCQNFSPYDCRKYSCVEYQDATSITYPYFKGVGHPIKAEAYLDYNFWNLDTKAVLSSSCINNKGVSYGSGAYGIIGLGIGGDAWANYRGIEPLFSIYLYSDGSGGELEFTMNPDKAKSEAAVFSLDADDNWHLKDIHTVQVGDINITTNLNMIFDLHSEAIGFPIDVYDRILQVLSNDGELFQCSAMNLSHPICNYSGDPKILRNISIHIGDQVLVLTPQTYVEKVNEEDSQGLIRLGLKALDNSSSAIPETYVVNEYYNFIILGSNFMQQYYTVFNATSLVPNQHTIELFEPAPRRPVSVDKSSISPLIIVGAVSGVLIVIVIAVGVYLKVRKSRNRNGGRSSRTKDEAPNNIKMPLIEEKNTSSTQSSQSSGNSSSSNGQQPSYFPLVSSSESASHHSEENKKLISRISNKSEPEQDSSNTLHQINNELGSSRRYQGEGSLTQELYNRNED